jgi:DNA primase
MIFSDDFVENVREQNDILDVVSSYVSVAKKGHNYMGLCPFHPEKTPSFCVYHSTNSFYCFGCGAGGDVITFIMLAEKLQYREAVEFLANKAGISIPKCDENDNFLDRKTIFAMNRLSAKFFFSCLMDHENKLALGYLLSRGLLKKTIVHFGLGYSKSDGYSLVNFLKKNGFSDEKIEKANLGVKTKNNFLRDRFVNRIMFPIINIKGNVIGFGARSLDNGMPKYLNTAETIAFNKSENLFALNFAKNQEYFILTEGYMDAVALYQLGFKSAIASLGTSLTLGQAKLISRYTGKIYVCYDSDIAGRKATKRAIEILKKENLDVKIIEMKDAKDPDEFVKINKEQSALKFKFLIKSSKNSIEFKISELENKFDINKIEEKVSFLKEVSKIISEIYDPIERDVYSSKICSKYGILKSAFDLKIKKNLQKKNKIALASLKKNQKFAHSGSLYIEEFLISCIIKNNDLMVYFDDFSGNDFSDKVSSELFIKIRALLSSGKTVNFSSLSAGFDQKKTGEISRILNLNASVDVSESEFLKYFGIFKQRKEINDFKLSENLEDNKILKFLDKLKKSKV